MTHFPQLIGITDCESRCHFPAWASMVGTKRNRDGGVEFFLRSCTTGGPKYVLQHVEHDFAPMPDGRRPSQLLPGNAS